MDAIAQWPPAQRDDLFRETASQRAWSAVIVAKDFWVCWVLRQMFALPPPHGELIFKGGTSLSKGYGLIERFSEDVDLSVSRETLGFTGERDPERAGLSQKWRERLLTELQGACQVYLAGTLLPTLRERFAAALAGQPDWELRVADDDAQTLLFAYPGRAGVRQEVYVKPVVRLELGARSDQWPAEWLAVRPYAADAFPEVFRVLAARVHVLRPERTFWEKATLLHAEFHRPAEKPAPPRLARHYYDLARLAATPVAARALADGDLRDRVRQHKSCFFRCGWARYEQAVPGTFRLVPPDSRLSHLREDYRRMQDLFFTPPPELGTVLATLRDLEQRING